MVQISNQQISSMLSELASLRELEGANTFSILAIREGAKIIAKVKEDPLTTNLFQYENIGPKLSSKIREAASTGQIKELSELREKYPNLYDLTRIKGIGIKRALKLFHQYQVSSRKELFQLFLDDKAFDPQLRDRVERSLNQPERFLSGAVMEMVSPLLTDLRKATERLEVAGSIRRKVEMIKDVDILVTNENISETLKVFQGYGRILSGENSGIKSSITFFGRLQFQIDLLLVSKESWGAALCYFTGSKNHNIKLRSLAKQQGLMINEYGIFRGEEKIGGEKEEDLYNILNLPFIQPEMRE